MDDSSLQSNNTNIKHPVHQNTDRQSQIDGSNLKSKANKKYLLILLLVLVVIGSLATTYKYLSKNRTITPSTPVTQEQKQQEQKQEEQKPTGPISLIFYEYSDASANDFSLKLRSLKLSNNEKSIFDTKDKSQFDGFGFAIYGQQVAVIGKPFSNGQESDKIFYSNNSGASFDLIFSTKPNDRITDLKFSSDGSVIIFGLYHNTIDVTKNTVTELNLKSKTTTDLFTSDSAGIFLIGYNKGKQILYHKINCYGCDGAPGGNVYSYDLITKKESEIITAEGLIESVVVNRDFNELLYADSSHRETESGFPESVSPYKLRSYDLTTNKSKEVQTFGEANKHLNVKFSYTKEGAPYYSYEKNIFGINSDGKPTTLYTSTKSIYDIYYVSQDSIYLSLGTYDEFSVNKFTVEDQKSTNLIDGKQTTTIIGITNDD